MYMKCEKYLSVIELRSSTASYFSMDYTSAINNQFNYRAVTIVKKWREKIVYNF